jgi:type II secretory pathway pseudopilin PulG
LLTFNKKYFKRRSQEDGITLAEVMVAIVVIAILLVASASAFATAISASVLSQTRNQAIQISQDIISVAKQAPFSKLGLVLPQGSDTPPSQCSETWTGKYNGINIITQTTKYPGLVYCQTVEIPDTGLVYAAYTYITPITYSNTDNFDAPSATAGNYGSKWVPRRVTVKVVWFDNIKNDGSVTYQSVTQSYIRTPTISDCIPTDNYSTGSPTPPGCAG